MQRLAAAALLFLSILAYGIVRTPLPGVNEPHYLTKAKHYWNPSWCPGDFFLDSANAHLVFFQTVGSLTRWLTLEQTAWLGRIAAYSLLAAGWTALAVSLLPGRWTGVWALWTYLAIAAVGNLSGEWIVGGVEAKLFSYGFLFAALAGVIRGRWCRAGIWGGLAVSFHPVVGGWAAVAAVWAFLAGAVPTRTTRTENGETPIRRTRMLSAALLLVLFAIPGIVPAVGMLGAGSPEADVIQMFSRLPHHMLPATFPVSAYISYALLILFWRIARRRAEFAGNERWFARFIAGIALIAACGLVAGWQIEPHTDHPLNLLRIKFLKLYPFRLFDSMLPLTCAVALAAVVQRWLSRRTAAAVPESSRRRQALAWLAFGGLMAASLLLPAPEFNPSRMQPRRLADWHDACQWISENTPADALFLAPTHESFAFRWYALRAAYVTYKDCPQDQAGILEWDRRLKYVRRWARENHANGFSRAELFRFHQKTGVTHVVTRQLGPFEMEPIYRNRTFRVYRLPVSEMATARTTRFTGSE